MNGKPPSSPQAAPPVEGVDYVVDELGRWIFTREYHLKRGSCCESGCRHCPYGFKGKGSGGEPADES